MHFYDAALRCFDRLMRYRDRCMPGGKRAIKFTLIQFRQKSTIAAVLSAIALLLGWKIEPEKLASISLLLSIADSIVLAAIQERGPLPPPTDCSTDDQGGPQ